MSKEDTRLLGLSTLLQLEKSARQADSQERLGFIICNETHRLFRYHQAVLWLNGSTRPRVHTVSGLAQADTDSPYLQWLQRLLQVIQKRDEIDRLEALSIDDFPSDISTDWVENIPGKLLHCPLVNEKGRAIGGLLLLREEEWQPAELAMLEMLLDAYRHAWLALGNKRTQSQSAQGLKRYLAPSVATILFIAGFLPISMSTLAPAEVIPRNPWIVASPQNGVAQRMHVQPNQRVKQGDLLFELDDTEVRNALEVARKARDVANAEYLRASQRAFSDQTSKGEVRLFKARREQAEAEVHYNQDRLSKMRILAEREGIAVYSDPQEWIGKPLRIGERVMTLASPEQVQLRIWLPTADAFIARNGAQAQFFRDTDPTNPVPAQLHNTAYEAELSPDGQLAFRLGATFSPDSQTPRLGIQGTARIYGEKVTLYYFLFRRPLAVLRQWLGL